MNIRLLKVFIETNLSNFSLYYFFLKDENDNPPEFSQSSYIVRISENMVAGTFREPALKEPSGCGNFTMSVSSYSFPHWRYFPWYFPCSQFSSFCITPRRVWQRHRDYYGTAEIRIFPKCIVCFFVVFFRVFFLHMRIAARLFGNKQLGMNVESEGIVDI